MAQQPITVNIIVNAALIVAAGRGHRAGAGVPKQYRPLPGSLQGDPFAQDSSGGRSVLAASIQAFSEHCDIDHVCVVIHKSDVKLYKNVVNNLDYNNISYCYGGNSRQESVCNGLGALAALKPRQVLIHDAARPFVSADLISRCVVALGSAVGAIPAIAVADTLKRADKGQIVETVSRDGLWHAQTPQAFNFAAIYTAHQKAPRGLTDDAAVAEFVGLSLALVAGDRQNIKLTEATDFVHQPRQTPHQATPVMLPRQGTGFDVHRFDTKGSAKQIRLGGIDIAHDRALLGHSDADVALHALTDALLGALALGDIGDYFPPSDDRHKGRDSADFIAHAMALAKQGKARLTHVDLTIICESPKITPHKAAIKHRLSALLGLDETAISIKATTTEGLGFTGRGEGLAALASATMLLPAGE